MIKLGRRENSSDYRQIIIKKLAYDQINENNLINKPNNFLERNAPIVGTIYPQIVGGGYLIVGYATTAFNPIHSINLYEKRGDSFTYPASQAYIKRLEAYRALKERMVKNRQIRSEAILELIDDV